MQSMQDILCALDEQDVTIKDDSDIQFLVRKFYQEYQDIDLFVWDFDKTITKFSTTHSKYSKSTKRKIVLNQIADPDLYYHLIIFLLNKGKKVAIASWNDEKFFRNRFGGVLLIRFFMDALFSSDCKQQIFTKNNIVSYWPKSLKEGKNTHLRELSKWFNVPKNKIILFDDNIDNIRKASDEGYNVNYVPADVNFTREHLINILG